MNKIEVTACLAEDWGKHEYDFFKKFDSMDIKTCERIYGVTGLPDPDAFSERLYDFYETIWNSQRQKLNLNLPEVQKVWNGQAWELVGVADKSLRLGTDSVMSIYWHRCDMRGFIAQLIEAKGDDFKHFIRDYLQDANTTGGFMLFPRHRQSLNQARGVNAVINDRFDFTLECIRRNYLQQDNPLQAALDNDKAFFDSFGTFEKYVDFFCLNNSWVKDGQVFNLMDNKSLENYNFDKNPLPTKDNWWGFYNNIMERLSSRNEQIEKLNVE